MRCYQPRLADSSASTVYGGFGVSRDSDICVAGTQTTVLPAAESSRLAEYLPRPQRSAVFEGRTQADKKRPLADASPGLMLVENELEIALCLEEGAILEEALMVNREVSVDIPTGRINDLPPLPKPQAEVSRSPFRKAFEFSQMVKLDGLIDVGCFEFVDMKGIILRGRKMVDSKWVHSYKSDEFGNFVKSSDEITNDCVRVSTQVQHVDYHETISSIPASSPMKIIAVASNELGLLVFHLDLSQAVRTGTPLKRIYIYICVSLRGVVSFRVGSLNFSSVSTD